MSELRSATGALHAVAKKLSAGFGPQRAELKFVAGEAGMFEGYGAVFGNVDAMGDMISPGAFTASLANWRARGLMPGLYAEHSFFTTGGDLLPVGTWLDLREDDQGLRGVGRISAIETDFGQRILSLMRDGALRGLSIAFSVPFGGSVLTGTKKPGEAKRILRAIDLSSIDIVRDPANNLARIDTLYGENSDARSFLH